MHQSSFAPVRLASVAVLATLVSGCDLWLDHDDGDSRVQAHVRARQASVLVPGPEVGRRPLRVRRGEPIEVAFSAALDPAAAREAVRVVDEGRHDAPVPVEVDVVDARLRIRPRDRRGFRRGARLRVTVAGLPSVRALRGSGGATLDEELALRVRVRGPSRAERDSARIDATRPLAGATDVDPSVHVTVTFSHPMDPDGFVTGPAGARPSDLLVTAGEDGAAVRFRSLLDRSHRVLTLVPPAGGWPEGRVRVAVALGARTAAGGRMADDVPAEFSFDVGAGAAAAPEWLFETFETADRADPRGTTVAWDGRAEPGVLLGEIVSSRLDLGPRAGATAPGERRFLALDGEGGRLRFVLPAAELGDEAGVLDHLRLLGAPAHAAGRMLEPRVRVAPLDPHGLHPEGRGLGPPDWQDVGGTAPAVTVIGSDLALEFPFRHPIVHDGVSDLLVEVAWSGLTRGIVLAGEDAPDLRTVAFDASGRAMPLAFAPRAQVDRRGDRAVARSRWVDAGGPVDWSVPVLRPDLPLDRVHIELQGAPTHPGGTGPDPDRVTPWTDRPERLAGLRWVRFRILFDTEPALPPAFVDDVALPFHRR